MPKIRINREEAADGDLIEKEWDIKKIIGGVLILALLFILGSYLFIPKGEDFAQNVATRELSPTPPLPDKEDISRIIEEAQVNLSQITADNITSSQAAVQKIISDLQGIQGKEGAIGLLCKLACSDKN